MNRLTAESVQLIASATEGESSGRTWAIALFFGIALGIFIKVAQHRAKRSR